MGALGFTPLSKHKRIVIKIGSSLLVDTDTGALKETWLSSLADDLAALAKQGAEIVLVSSGAIAMGRVMLGMQARPDRLEDAQASAAVGQIALAAPMRRRLAPVTWWPGRCC
jgi:glutamate 5-kinase